LDELEVEIGAECHRHVGCVLRAQCGVRPPTALGNGAVLRLGFPTAAAAAACRDLMHGRLFDGRTLIADVDGLPSLPPVAPPPPPSSFPVEQPLPPPSLNPASQVASGVL
jgi:hypothetical protein